MTLAEIIDVDRNDRPEIAEPTVEVIRDGGRHAVEVSGWDGERNIALRVAWGGRFRCEAMAADLRANPESIVAILVQSRSWLRGIAS